MLEGGDSARRGAVGRAEARADEETSDEADVTTLGERPARRAGGTVVPAEAELAALSPASARPEPLAGRSPPKPEQAPRKKRRKRRAADARDKSAKTPKPPGSPKPGSTKGIETMYRNAYRAELDIIALAATKANIMISLNGLIVSALMISGGFLYDTSAHPLLLLPLLLFLSSSVVSIYFALLAASPERVDAVSRALVWARDVLGRRASVDDFLRYQRRGRDFVEGQSNILIYEDRVKLSKESYQSKMRTLRGDREDVYEKMSDQLYWLGRIASTKFRMLGNSYSAFRWGVALSVLSFLGVKSLETLPALFSDAPPPLARTTTASLQGAGIARFSRVYEPSAAVQLPDGRLLLAEDEPDRALRLASFLPDGRLEESTTLDARLVASLGREVGDLEGMSIGPDGQVYAVTSHSRPQGGARTPAREQLLRFRVDGGSVTSLAVHETLVDDLRSSATLRETLAGYTGRDVLSEEDVNIEGLHFDATRDALVLGLREPTVDDLSLLVTIANPQAMFDHGAPPLVSEAALVDVGGGGIRSLAFDSSLDVWLIANESRKGARSRLWAWSGVPGETPEELDFPGLDELENIEALEPVVVNGQPRLLIASDDGVELEGRPASYLTLDRERLWKRRPEAPE